MKFTPTIPDDLPQIAEWIAADPHHRDDADAMSWMPFATNCIVSTCVEDKSGPVLYFKVSKEDDFARMSVQFAPPKRVIRSRVVAVLMEGFPVMVDYVREQGFKGLLFFSESKPLIRFMKRRFHFEDRGVDDYVLRFEERVQ